MSPRAYVLAGEGEQTVLEEIISESLAGCCPPHLDAHEHGPCCQDEGCGDA